MYKEYKKTFPEDLVTWLDNLNGKSGINYVLGQNRTGANSRIELPYKYLYLNRLDNMNFINSCNNNNIFEGGCYIAIINEELETLNIEKEKGNEVAKYLLENLGGDKNISSYLLFTSEEGNSGSKGSRDFYENYGKNYIEANNLEPICRNTNFTKNKNKGNEKIKGHYHVNLKGGSNDSIIIPNIYNDKRNIKPDYQLFNPYFDYCSKEVQNDRLYKFIFQILYCKDINEYISDETKIKEYKELLKKELETKDYLDGNLYEKSIEYNNGIKFIKDDILICPLTMQPISIKKFKDENNPIQLCHEESVAHRKIYYDSEKKK